jgi:nicotinate phosphoribosyltransferase
MGGRRTHEYAAVAAARAAYLAGFATTSNLEAGRRYGIPTRGTVAHAFMLLHDSEEAAFRAQVEKMGADTTLLVDTYDITAGIETAVRVAGPELGAIRIDSGDVGPLARRAREQLDSLGAKDTRIVVSGDLDEHAIAALRAEPVDAYGVGTSVVTGSGAPTAGMVYKLVEVDGRPVAKRSAHKESRGGRKDANDRPLQIPLIRAGRAVADLPTLDDARQRLRRGLVSLPWEGLKLSHGEPAIPTLFL